VSRAALEASGVLRSSSSNGIFVMLFMCWLRSQGCLPISAAVLRGFASMLLFFSVLVCAKVRKRNYIIEGDRRDTEEKLYY
jgi:hypothetical protein